MKFFKWGALAMLASCAPPVDMALPSPVSNNALAYHAPSKTIYSFAGIGAEKNWSSVHAKSYRCALESKTCAAIAPLPGGIGRLAATAQIIGDTIYIFGGYSVAQDGTEVSIPEVWAYDIISQTYSRKADMPVPVDDSVSIRYKDRYIYLISGWHKDSNVADVQMYDNQNDSWKPATKWPGVPVFGHAGGSVGSALVVCDGVQIVSPKTPQGRRSFTDISACWRGDIDKANPAKIAWRKLPQLPGKGNYRMAATGWSEENIVLFAGGSDNPYNYGGIGYDKTPSQPSAHVWGYDIMSDKYIVFKDKPVPTMDHRALIHIGGSAFVTLGGMGENQTVLGTLNTFKARRLPN